MTVNPKIEYRKLMFACLLLLVIVWVGHLAG
jgi:hypothetical protein